MRIRTTRKKADWLLLVKLVLLGGIPVVILYFCQAAFCHVIPESPRCHPPVLIKATKEPPRAKRR